VVDGVAVPSAGYESRAAQLVYATVVNVWSGGVIIAGMLVGMDNDNTIDSGGPWSFGSEATGGHWGDVLLTTLI
jgi:hypothetical protein